MSQARAASVWSGTALCGLIGVVAAWLFSAGLRAHRCAIVDDAFITFRFAEHLRQGHGLVWNLGEAPVEGASNLSFVAVLALLGGVIDMVSLSSVVGVLSALASAAAIVVGLRGRVSAPAAWLCAGIYLALPATAVHARAGLETSLYTALLAWFAVALDRYAAASDRKRAVWVAVAYAGAMLSRPEAGLIAGAGLVGLLAFTWLARRDGGGALRIVGLGAVCAALLAACLGWKLWYFGTVLSPPYWVKAAGQAALPGAASVAHFVVSYGPLWLAALFVATRDRALHGPWVYGSIALVNTVFFAFTAPLVAFEARYLVPALPLLLILAGPAIDALLALAPRPAQRVLAPLALVLLVPGTVLSRDHGFVELQRLLQRAPLDRCEATWTGRNRQIGLRLAALGEDGLRIVAEDVGALGYYTTAAVLDPVGLTHEAIARSSSKDAFADLVFGFDADLIVLRSNVDGSRTAGGGHGALGRFGGGAILDDPRFRAYRVVAIGPEGSATYRWQLWAKSGSPRAERLAKVAGYEHEPLR